MGLNGLLFVWYIAQNWVYKDFRLRNKNKDTMPQDFLENEMTTNFCSKLFEHGPNGYVILDKRLKLMDANHQARIYLGLQVADNTKKIKNLSFPTFLIKGVSQFLAWIISAYDSPLDVEFYHPSQAGQVRLYRNIIEHNGEKYYLLTFISILEDMLLNQSRDLFRIVFDNAREGIVITDAKRRIIDVNQVFTEITGYSRSEVLGKDPKILASGQTPKSVYESLELDLKDRGFWRGVLFNRTKDGKEYAEELKIAVYASSIDAPPEYYIGFFEDVSHRLKSVQRLTDVAEQDALTQIYNRTGFNRYITDSFANVQRTGGQLTVMFLDLDKFKQLNDTYGHQYGDALLIALAGRLKNQIKQKDFVARLGGDEFVIVLEGEYNQLNLLGIASKLLEKLKHPYEILGIRYECTVSIGIASYPMHALTIDNLLRNADIAMYQAKGAGRNLAVVYDAELHNLQIARTNRLAEIKNAIANNEFFLHYQPQHNIKTGQLVGFEGLVRWHKANQVILPGEWLPLIENEDFMISLGNSLLTQAFQQVSLWQYRGFKWPVSVNLSNAQLQSPALIKHLQSLVEKLPESVPLIHLEVLETSFFESNENIIANIKTIIELGIKMVLDDFGTGHSSIYSLKKFPFDKIKIDRGFVADITDEKQPQVVLDGIIDLLQAMKLDFICEGVETQAQVDYLLAKDCNQIQGFYYSRALPKEQVITYARPFLTDQV